MRFVKKIVLLSIALALFAIPLHAGEESDGYEGLPAYTITRLKIYEGSAWVRTPDSGDWEEFSSNSPVPVRSLVSIPEGSEAELQFHGGQFVLLTGGTELSLLDMREAKTSFRLRSGEVRFYLPETDFAPVGITVPGGGRADFSVPGRYWLAVAKGGDATLVVREGEGTVTVGRGEFPVKAGEQASIGEEVRVGKFEGEGAESFEKPPPLSDAEKQAGVPPAAAHELRDYGEWVNSAEYGYVWRPRVSPGWSPYYYGRWVWISPYGWTWVSYEPWGWYPYHYGYWYTDPVFGWVWWPFHSFVSFSFVFGHDHYHHYHKNAYYYPARVRFVHEGRHVRWVPLRPRERTGRIAYTRSDTRLASWERPLARETVYVRQSGTPERKWRDWTSVRRERREAAGTPDARIQTRERRETRGGPGGSPDRVERKYDRSIRGRSERPAEKIRPTDRPGGDVPARPQRWQRESPPPVRSERRSRSSSEGSGEPSRAMKYERRVWDRVPSTVQVPPARSPASSPSVRGERVPTTRGGGNAGGRASGSRVSPGPVPRGGETPGGSQPSRSFSVEGGRGFRDGGGRGWERGGGSGSSWGGRGGRSIR